MRQYRKNRGFTRENKMSEIAKIGEKMREPLWVPVPRPPLYK